MSKAVRMVTGLAVVFISAAGNRAEAACCRASCIGPVPWVACFADTTSCNTIPCVDGGSTSLAVDPTGTCGEGILFASCPPSEVGRCSDAVNNDGWVDAVTDLDDPDCASQVPGFGVPVASSLGVAAIVAILIGVGARRLRRTWQA